MNLLLNEAWLSLFSTQTSPTEDTLLDDWNLDWGFHLNKIIKPTRLSHTPRKGKIVCDEWVYVIDGIIIVEHILTHRCYYYFRL